LRLRSKDSPSSHPKRSDALSVCIVAPSAYGALCGEAQGFIGGAERLAVTVARWFAEQGHATTMITWQEGGPMEEIIHGVRVLKTCGHEEGVPGVRFFYPKWAKLAAALRKADADIYYQNLAECVTGQTAFWCRLHRRRFAFFLTSDTDCDPASPELHGLLERLFYRWGLRLADCRVAQTVSQQRRLSANFRLDSSVMPLPFPLEESAAPRADTVLGRVLWIGRVCQVKRPDRLAAVAKACPDMSFDMVGPLGDDAGTQQVVKEARQVPNITVHGRVSREQIRRFLATACCLCSTSDYEGFPTTFLEAWSSGLPVVSTFDPDDIIARHELGFVGADVAGLISGIRSLRTSPDRYGMISNNARRYFLENHEARHVLPRMEQLFRSLLADANRPAKSFPRKAWREPQLGECSETVRK
jgi:glycosyltransferase involved in cell wall biosynthesis